MDLPWKMIFLRNNIQIYKLNAHMTLYMLFIYKSVNLNRWYDQSYFFNLCFPFVYVASYFIESFGLKWIVCSLRCSLKFVSFQICFCMIYFKKDYMVIYTLLNSFTFAINCVTLSIFISSRFTHILTLFFASFAYENTFLSLWWTLSLHLASVKIIHEGSVFLHRVSHLPRIRR